MLMGIPLRSLYRKMSTYSLRKRDQYSGLSDEDLELIVRQIINENPLLGWKLISARILAMGHKIKRKKIRDAIFAVCGPRNLPPPVSRRVYSVRAPLSLVHIDGNHKLINYGLVVHGGIDGFSRLVYFMKVSSNNRSTTVLEGFLDGVVKHGIPPRVRVDKGGENVLIGYFMLAARGLDRGSFITGKSVHNQRIERLWLDVSHGVVSVFHRTFEQLMGERVLDQDNQIDLFCLHLVYIPLIQQFINEFIRSWNLHGLSTVKGHLSPVRLFELGLFTLRERGEMNGETYAELDQNVHIPDCIPSGQAWINDEAELSIPSIVVPEIVVPLSEEVRQHVRDMIPGNSIRLQEARELYLNIRNFDNEHLDSD